VQHWRKALNISTQYIATLFDLGGDYKENERLGVEMLRVFDRAVINTFFVPGHTHF